MRCAFKHARKALHLVGLTVSDKALGLGHSMGTHGPSNLQTCNMLVSRHAALHPCGDGDLKTGDAILLYWLPPSRKGVNSIYTAFGITDV